MRWAAVPFCALLLGACAAPPIDSRAAPSVRGSTRSVPAAARDLDCADLPRPGDAEGVLALDPRDPFRLDADDDGIPCER